MIGARFAQTVLERFPDARLRITEAFSPELRDMLCSGAIDIAAVSGTVPAPTHSVAIEPLLNDRLCLIGSASDAFMQRAELKIGQLQGLPLILTGMTSAGVRNEVEALAARRRISLNVAVEANSINLAIQMIRMGMGYTVYVATSVEKQRDLRAVPIAQLFQQRSLAWSLERPMSRLASEVLAILREESVKLVESGGWRGATLTREARSAKMGRKRV